MSYWQQWRGAIAPVLERRVLVSLLVIAGGLWLFLGLTDEILHPSRRYSLSLSPSLTLQLGDHAQLLLDGRARWETRYAQNHFERDERWSVSVAFDDYKDGTANTLAMVNRILALKPAGVTGWSDPENGVGAANPVSTGEALYGLCLAGVRLDQYPEVKNALDWLVSQQLSSGCVIGNPTVGTMGGCFPSTTGTFDVPTTFAALGLSCYGVLNVNISATNVAPADPGQAGAAKLAPGGGSTQTVTFNVNIFNNGYDINSFNLAASGGFAGNGGTNITLSNATVSVAPNATGTFAATAT